LMPTTPGVVELGDLSVVAEKPSMS
jgi:hypothetical protein